MAKDFDLIEFITSHVAPKKFQEGGVTDYGDIAGQIFAVPPAGSGSTGGYDLGAWDMEAFLDPQYDAAAAALAGITEGAEAGQMAQQQDRRDVVKQELAKIGRQGKVAFLFQCPSKCSL